jgi:hypothetical protein
LFTTTALTHGQPRQPPRVEDYPALETFEGEVHPPNYVTEEQKRYKKEIDIVAIRRPNFAGRLSVVEMFCGPGCEEVALVDARDGTIYPSPFGKASSPFSLPPPNWDMQQPRYMSLSRLFIVPNVCPDEPSKCHVLFCLGGQRIPAG